MKTILLLTATLFIAQLGFSQSETANLLALNTKKESPYTVKKSPRLLNADYIDQVTENSMANHVRALELQVSNFDVTSASGYKGKTKPFEVVFQSNKGFIKAFYDENGKVIETVEKFKDVKLPNAVRDNIFKAYSNATLLKTDYYASYKNGSIEKTYEVTIKNNKSKIKVRVNSNGEIL